MAEDDTIAEVWCENQDDITLIHELNGSVSAEYVQVKTDDLNQLWSVSSITTLDRTKPGNSTGKGTSIYEKSLKNDDYEEKALFRIVTEDRPQKALRVLALPRGHEDRAMSTEAMQALVSAIESKPAGKAVSGNGNGTHYWIDNTVWESLGNITQIQAANLLKLETLIESYGATLAPDQKQSVYDKLLKKVQDAAYEESGKDLEKSKIKRIEFVAWLKQTIAEQQHPVSVGGGDKLRRKLEAVTDDDTLVKQALELRMSYRRTILNPDFLSFTDRDSVATTVVTELHEERMAYVEDESPKDKQDLLRRSIDRMGQISDDSKPLRTKGLLMGCMYDIVNRCLHDFA